MVQKWFCGFLVFISFIGAAEAKSTVTRKIAILGDSITEGYGVEKSAAYPAVVEALLKKKGHKDVEVINSGVSGSTTASGPKRLQWVLKSKPYAVMLALGSNDALRGISVEASKKNLSEMIGEAQKAKVKVILAGVMPPPNYGTEYTQQFQKIFRELANQYKLEFIPFLLEGVGGEKDLNQYDAIHPNEKGHQKIAEHILKHLENIL